MGTQAIAEFSRHLMQASEIDSLSIFFCDRRAPRPKLVYLLHEGVSMAAQGSYIDQQVFHDDPFTDVALNEQDGGMADRFIAVHDERLSRIAPPDGRYWDFTRHFGIDVVGASVRGLAPRLYSTIGLHRRPGRPHCREVPEQQLSPLALRLQDMVGAFLLADMLRMTSGVGGAVLPRFLVKRHGPGSPFARLAEREREIAELVCQGRRNKEIAWITRLSEHTVENYLRRIFAKLGIHNRASLVAMLAEAGAAT